VGSTPSTAWRCSGTIVTTSSTSDAPKALQEGLNKDDVAITEPPLLSDRPGWAHEEPGMKESGSTDIARSLPRQIAIKITVLASTSRVGGCHGGND